MLGMPFFRVSIKCSKSPALRFHILYLRNNAHEDNRNDNMVTIRRKDIQNSGNCIYNYSKFYIARISIICVNTMISYRIKTCEYRIQFQLYQKQHFGCRIIFNEYSFTNLRIESRIVYFIGL